MLYEVITINGHWLVDGALVNPVPVSVCRALGAQMIIAVNLNADIMGIEKRSLIDGRITSYNVCYTKLLRENRGNVYEFAHTLIDAGADVVFGHGPHVPRAIEVYKGRFRITSYNVCYTKLLRFAA